MNRYPLWKYAIVVLALVIGFIYTLPNFYGDTPAVQISSAKATLKVDARTEERVLATLAQNNIEHQGIFLDATGVKVRLKDTDTQLQARDRLEKEFAPNLEDADYTISPNLLSASPEWLSRIFGAKPMYLGLDLRGGVHFLMQVDMKGATTKRVETLSTGLRTLLREKEIRYSGVARDGERLIVRFRDAATREAGKKLIEDRQPDLLLIEEGADEDLRLIAALKPEAVVRIQEESIAQNMTTLHNRINELGVAEPVITQQGADRIVVQLPGVQDVAAAKRLIGRTATLEVRLVDEDASRTGNSAGVDVVPERDKDGSVRNVYLKKQVIITGDQFSRADATFDNNQQPAVSVRLDATGGKIMGEVTRENRKKLMAIVLFEKGKGEAISVASINGEFSDQFQITGNFSSQETNQLAILIRAGALAAPMDIIEERLIGPSLGAENIAKGFNSTLWGFAALALFMICYYQFFGVFSVLALGANLLFLVALLSLLQATLTLPGIAAMALTLGMAIDANVLINERIREELRAGVSPQLAIKEGYERAFGTILDSNITTLIAGIALLTFGSGAIRGFAVVHSLGILTSLFSSVLVSRAIVNLAYGGRKIDKLRIGQIWKPDTQTHSVAGAKKGV